MPVFLFRTGFEKKRKAVDWCGTNTMKWLQGEDENALPPPPKIIKKGPTSDKKYDDNEPHCHPPNLGDVVAVPFMDGDSEERSFWLGKCLRVNNEDSTLLLGWFQEVGEGKYRMKIGASWPEVSILHSHSLAHSLIHSFIHSLIHSLIRLSLPTFFPLPAHFHSPFTLTHFLLLQ